MKIHLLYGADGVYSCNKAFSPFRLFEVGSDYDFVRILQLHEYVQGDGSPMKTEFDGNKATISFLLTEEEAKDLECWVGETDILKRIYMRLGEQAVRKIMLLGGI